MDDEIIFEYNRKTEDFWVPYNAIWSVFENRFGMEYGETQELIQFMVEDHYKLGSVTPTKQALRQWPGWKNITNWDQ